MAQATVATRPAGAEQAEPTRGTERSLDPDQGAAVHAPLGRPLLVVAGPGAGKTRVLTQRIVHLVRSGAAAPAQVVAITFTNAAATEMSERVQAELSAEQAGVRISTIHALAAQVVRRHPEARRARRTVLDLRLRRSAAAGPLGRSSAPSSGVDAHELVRRIGAAKANLEDSALWMVRGEAGDGARLRRL